MTPLLFTLAAFGATQRFGLVIGANDGGAARPALRYAETDADAFARVITDLGGVSAEQLVVLGQPSRSDIARGWSDIRARVATAEQAGERTEVLVYYSGHSDDEGLLLGQERYDYTELRAAVESLGSDVRVVVLDSCQSGAMVRSKGGVVTAPFLVDTSVDVQGLAVLTSSAADEVSQETDRIGGSYFTHYLLTGLRGGADASSDGRVTLNEAYQFAYHETLARTERSSGGAQHAAYDIQLAGSGDLVLTDLSAVSASVVLDPGLAGRVTVRDHKGNLVAELNRAPGRPLELGLGPGRYTIWVDDQGEVREAQVELVEGDRRIIGATDFSPASVELARARGDASGARSFPVRVELFPIPPLKPRHNARVQVSLTAAVAGEIGGMQTGIIAAVAERVDGAQLSAAVAVAEGVDGAQLSAGVATAQTVDGAQLAAGVAVARSVAGAQVAAGVAVSDAVSGWQSGAGAAIVGEGSGLQTAGGFTFARHFRGVQLAPINIAGQVDGAQIGVINIARDADESIAVIAINGAGYNHLWLAPNLMAPASAGLTWGGKHFYTGLELGMPLSPEQSWHKWLGLGWHQQTAGRLWVDGDLAVGGATSRLFVGDSGLTVRARLLVGASLAEHLGVFAGPTLALPLILPEGPVTTPLGSYGPGDVVIGLSGGVRI
jgi:Caspase domain